MASRRGRSSHQLLHLDPFIFGPQVPIVGTSRPSQVNPSPSPSSIATSEAVAQPLTRSLPLVQPYPLPPPDHLPLNRAHETLLCRKLAQLRPIDCAIQRHNLEMVPMRPMPPHGPRRIPHLVPAHGTVLEAAAQPATEHALLRPLEVAFRDARPARGDAVEDAEQDGAG